MTRGDYGGFAAKTSEYAFFKKLKQNTDSEVHVRPNNHDNQSKNVQQSHHFTREAIKQRMEKDVDEVGKIARFIKEKIEELDKEVSAVKSGRIQVNGKTVSISYRVKSSDKITHFLHRHEPPVMALDVTILHKGEDVLTVCKPASVPVHPCGQYRKNTVVGILEAEHNITPLFPIHRLDRLVSGLLILARSAAQADIFRQQIENGTVQKQYIAKVVGEFPEEEATQHGVIGIDLYGAWYEPYADVPEDVLAAQRSRTFNVGWCADPLVFGDYPDMMKKRAGSRLPTFTKVEKRTIKGSFDFLGVNHYNAESVKHIPNVKLQIRRDDKAQIEQAHRRVPITRPDLVQRTRIP